MEDDQNGRRPKWKTKRKEDDQNRSRIKQKTTKMEDDLYKKKETDVTDLSFAGFF